MKFDHNFKSCTDFVDHPAATVEVLPEAVARVTDAAGPTRGQRLHPGPVPADQTHVQDLDPPRVGLLRIEIVAELQGRNPDDSKIFQFLI